MNFRTFLENQSPPQPDSSVYYAIHDAFFGNDGVALMKMLRTAVINESEFTQKYTLPKLMRLLSSEWFDIFYPSEMHRGPVAPGYDRPRTKQQWISRLSNANPAAIVKYGRNPRQPDPEAVAALKRAYHAFVRIPTKQRTPQFQSLGWVLSHLVNSLTTGLPFLADAKMMRFLNSPNNGYSLGNYQMESVSQLEKLTASNYRSVLPIMGDALMDNPDAYNLQDYLRNVMKLSVEFKDKWKALMSQYGWVPERIGPVSHLLAAINGLLSWAMTYMTRKGQKPNFGLSIKTKVKDLVAAVQHPNIAFLSRHAPKVLDLFGSIADFLEFMLQEFERVDLWNLTGRIP